MCDPRELPPRANHRQPRPHTVLVMLSGMAACRSGQSPSGSSMHATGHRSPLLNSTTGFPSSPPRPWQPYVPKATSSNLLPPGGGGRPRRRPCSRVVFWLLAWVAARRRREEVLGGGGGGRHHPCRPTLERHEGPIPGHSAVAIKLQWKLGIRTIIENWRAI